MLLATLAMPLLASAGTAQPTSFITREMASEVVNLEPAWDSDPLPSSPERSGCPHEASGLRSWHDQSTWPSGRVPNDESDVEIPANTKVLISSTPHSPGGRLGQIHVPASSELIFADHGRGSTPIVLKTSGIKVQGALRMGAPALFTRAHTLEDWHQCSFVAKAEA